MRIAEGKPISSDPQKIFFESLIVQKGKEDSVVS